MNFDKEFWMRSIEQGINNSGESAVALVSEAEKSEAWKKHAQNCDRAQVVSVAIGKTKLTVKQIEDRNEVFDDSKWRSSLESRAKIMLEGNPVKIQTDEIKSDNFSTRSDGANQIYEKQLSCSVGCMCGVEIGMKPEVLKSNSYGVSMDAGSKSEVYVTSDDSGKSYKS